MSKPTENANCPYCLSPIGADEEKVRCPECGVVHHAECWNANGKCSVYGCDGWQAWSSEITEKIAPKLDGEVDVSESTESKSDRNGGLLCIRCGAPVAPGKIKCWECWRKEDRHFFDNCTGPSILILGGMIGLITLIVRALS